MGAREPEAMTRAWFAWVLGSLAIGACGRDERSGAAPVADAGVEASVDAPPPPALDAGPRIRSVETRNPFGPALADNLMIDGDFELTSASGQYGWRASGPTGEMPLLRETGGLCHSGVTCGVLTPEADLIGFAAAPKDQSVEVSIWTKPPGPDCELTVISLINCTGVFVLTLGDVPATQLEPDASGWCEHHASLPPVSVRPCLFAVSLADPEAKTLIDQGSLRGVAGSAPNGLTAGPPSPRLHARIARALDALNRHPRFGKAPPSSDW